MLVKEQDTFFYASKVIEMCMDEECEKPRYVLNGYKCLE
jgi:hypothetical protein